MSVGSVVISTERPSYYAGDTIRGNVTFEVVHSVPLNKVMLRLSGESNVGFDGYEEYVRSSNKVLSLSQNIVVEEKRYMRGTHFFPFEFETPPTLPSSFEGEHGSVAYKLHMKWPYSGYFPKTATLELKILATIDTNWQHYALPVLAKNEKTSGCYCFRSVEMAIDAQTDRTAYCPGELASVTAMFVNNSVGPVMPYANLARKDLYSVPKRSDKKQSKKEWLLRPTSRDAHKLRTIRRGRADDWDRLHFEIPECCPSISTETLRTFRQASVKIVDTTDRLQKY